MRRTFGSKLLEFANTVDILEEENFKKIQKYIEIYLADVLHIKYVRLMLIRETMGGDIILVKYALNKDMQQFLLVKKEGEYNGQMAYAFSEGRKLWITPPSKEETLNTSEIYIDHWSNRKDLPKFQQINDEIDIKTSVIIPISRNNKVNNSSNHHFGVVNFESQSYLKPNKQAQKELKDISYTLGKLFQLQEGRNFQKQNTSSVIDTFDSELKYLKDEYADYFFARKPKVFLAFSSRAEQEVINSIKEVISEKYAKKLKLISWDDKYTVGSITPQLLNNMKISEYLICYLSEKDEEAILYEDNANVLIELGYFIGKHERSSYLRNILIIREVKCAKKVPFDIQDIYTLDVPRDITTEEFHKKAFMEELNVKIKAILTEVE